MEYGAGFDLEDLRKKKRSDKYNTMLHTRQHMIRSTTDWLRNYKTNEANRAAEKAEDAKKASEETAATQK